LKEQALNLLAKTNGPIMLGNPEYRLRESEVEIIRRALEALPDNTSLPSWYYPPRTGGPAR
jgi:hypothetical protein